jgi:hypothetical protein
MFVLPQLVPQERCRSLGNAEHYNPILPAIFVAIFGIFNRLSGRRLPASVTTYASGRSRQPADLRQKPRNGPCD